MARSKIKVTDIEALEKWGEENGHEGLVKVVTEKREDKSKLRKLVKHASALKQTIPGVEVILPAKDTKQTDLEDAVAKSKAAGDKKETLPPGSKGTPVAASVKKASPPSNQFKKRA